MGGIWRDLSEWRQDFWQAAIYHGAARRIRRGRAPLTSLLLVISSLQVSIPAIKSPVPYTDYSHHPSFSAHGNRGPTSYGFGACHDQKQQYLAYSTRQLCVRQFGDQASYRQASFLTCLHAIAFVAFPFTNSYEDYTYVMIELCRSTVLKNAR